MSIIGAGDGDEVRTDAVLPIVPLGGGVDRAPRVAAMTRSAAEAVAQTLAHPRRKVGFRQGVRSR